MDLSAKETFKASDLKIEKIKSPRSKPEWDAKKLVFGDVETD